jgi:proteic killer suppression protein
VIRSFRHKGPRELFEGGRSRSVAPEHQARILRLLDVLDAAASPIDMHLPGFHFHRLRGKPLRYSVRVTGNWRLVFAWDESDAIQVDLEDYH